MFLEVKEIKFSDHKTARETKNFPESGFYMVEIEGVSIDLVMVDKTVPTNFIICPKSVADGLEFFAVNPDHHKKQEVLTTNDIAPKGFASESFILDFTKILLKQK